MSTRAPGTGGKILAEEAKNWPTARQEDAESCGNHPGAKDSLTGIAKGWQTPGTDSFRSRGGDRKDEPGLGRQAKNWKTPHGLTNNRDGGGGEFHKQVTHWPTPQEDNANNCGGPSRTKGMKHGGYRDLSVSAGHWPTPNQHDGTGARGKNFNLTDCHYKPHDLVTATDAWPTPLQSDHQSGVTGNIAKKNARPLREVACQSSVLAPRTSKTGASCLPSTPKLNPRFVELLMGLPPGQTASEPLEMVSFLWWLRSHTERLDVLTAVDKAA